MVLSKLQPFLKSNISSFQITVTSSWAKAEDARQKRELALGKSRKLLKRDAAIIIDNFPVEPVYTHRPKVIYRRVSRQKYGPPKPKPKYGPPRPKYGPPPPKPRKPSKKYRKQVSNKYGPPTHKRRTPKPKYGPPQRPNNKPVYGPPKKVPSHYHTPEPAGFAEPPTEYEPQQPPQQNYAEPPVDSYGAPLKLNEAYPTAQAYENPGHFGFTNFGHEFQSWQNDYVPDLNHDNSYEYSKKRPLYAKPEEVLNTDQNQEEEDFNLNSYHSDGFTINPNFKEPQYLHNRRRKPQFFDTNKKVNKHWKSPRFRQEIKQESDDEILVGGQYAEPPPRYVPKFQPSAPMFNGDDDFAPPQSYVDSEVAASATISPYVNYKHSNMAFSPQNLNDAFSIVDK